MPEARTVSQMQFGRQEMNETLSVFSGDCSEMLSHLLWPQSKEVGLGAPINSSNLTMAFFPRKWLVREKAKVRKGKGTKSATWQRSTD